MNCLFAAVPALGIDDVTIHYRPGHGNTETAESASWAASSRIKDKTASPLVKKERESQRLPNSAFLTLSAGGRLPLRRALRFFDSTDGRTMDAAGNIEDRGRLNPMSCTLHSPALAGGDASSH